MTYRAEIDGLRCIAVIPVVLFHLGFTWICGGYIGVDVFFVISGFLISTIILREVENDCFTFQGFWSRRVRRILPALIVMLTATLSIVCLYSFRGDSARFAIQGAAAVLSFSNIALWRNTGSYWGANAQDSPFLHTWSLSVEEQFYLIYPVFIVGLIRFSRRSLIPVLLLVTLSSFILYLFGAYYKPSAAFYLLPTRIWELGCGCLLAMWQGQGHNSKSLASFARRHSEALATVGLVAIIASYFVFSEDRRFPGHLAIPVLGSSLFIGFANRNTGVGRLVSLNPLVIIGKMSYSLYLWHWPVIVLVPIVFHSAKWSERTDCLLLLMTSFAYLSYRFVETPTRHASLSSKKFAFCFGLIAVSLSLCWHIHARSPFYDISQYAPVVWEGQSYVSAPVDIWAEWGEEMTHGIQASSRNPESNTAWKKEGIFIQHGTDYPEIVVLGDSHALMWAGTIDRIAASLQKSVSFYAAHDTSPFMTIPVQKSRRTHSFTQEERYVFDMNCLQHLDKWKPKVVVIALRWSKHAPPKNDLIEHLGKIGSKVLLVQQPPELYFGEKNALQYISHLRLQPNNDLKQSVNSKPNDADYREGQNYVRGICSRYKFCHAIEVEDIFRDSTTGGVYVLDGKNVLFLDDDHLSQHGAELLQSRIQTVIESVFKADR